ncbi:WD repeat-containing protein 89 isoform X2 [Tyto alba]|nr:WD repeat-containing protein 89 isoform X2 [Tyto alba]XP_032852265.2 WD repeat-containing protein 89 isoform X2 [Tyto alba]XP_032852266.2 WD repeat-containing protein 89 isoform X2 [Tyto alba]XP_032852268.2 WD repeat-containing protein 89 isoform X2 [Tyto alba]XP_032852269.2 WD repeat-containing protein 89 isoform X2 [Tyto alba]XP_032852270.2 WD repeat-containing protein 89 isoform X2 [Tyto alba]XP_032852271.2 WD repeat-containing protein 89 isoform X2 [Tyto alba]XP_042655176.1 WD repeat-
MTAVIEEQLASLRIAKRAAPSAEPAYLLDIDVSKPAQSASSRFVAVSCSNKSIRVYNRETLNFLREYSGRPGVLHGVRFAHACDSTVFSACSDGTVKCWDIRSAAQKAVQVFSGYPSNAFISFDINCSDLIICAGTEKVEKDTFLVFWDARGITNCASATQEPLGVYSESHNDDITKICFHPVEPNLVVSGSTDGLVNVFNINKDNEDDALISTCNSDSSVSFIGWSGKDYKQVYCVTHDEGFCWWDTAQLDTEEPITLLHVLDVRDAVCPENDSLHYLVGGFYHEKADKLFLIGGTSTGNIHLVGCGRAGLGLAGTLCGGHAAPVRSFCWSLADESLLTGGEDAQLLLWKPGAVERSLAKKASMKIASSVQKRVRVHNSSLKSRKK